jgi:hypothetical protein
VQANAGQLSGSNTGGGLSLEVSLPRTVNAHDTLILAADFTSATAPAVSDTLGNTFKLAVGPAGSSGAYAAIWVAFDARAGSDVVTFTIPTATFSDYIEGYAHEYSGLVAQDGIDQRTGTGTTISGGPVSTSAAGDLLFAFIAAGGVTPGAGFEDRSLFNGNVTEDEIVGPAGSYSASATQQNADGWIILTAAFRVQ